MNKPRIVFMGTPDFASQILQALITADFAPIAVYTNPDRPAGRSKKLLPSAVKKVALSFRIPVYQPERLRDVQVLEELSKLRPDLIVVASYGHILSKQIIDLPTFGSINVHASLLPELRGASPIHAAILQGKSETGITIMKMALQLDAGDALAQKSVTIAKRETFSTLHQKLVECGAQLLVDTIPRWIEGRITPRPQEESLATFTKTLEKDDGRIDWNKPAEEIDRQIRAFELWPQSFSLTPEGKRVKFFVAHPAARFPFPQESPVPGKVHFSEASIYIEAGLKSALEVITLQLEGKRPMPASEFIRGNRQFDGMVLS